MTGREGSRRRTVRVPALIVACAAVVVATPGPLLSAGAAPQLSGAVSASSLQPQQTLLRSYCVTCHNQRLQTAGLALDALDLERIAEHAEVWEKVVRKLRAGVMPPAGRPRPSSLEYDRFASWLEGELDRAAAVAPDPGRTDTLHRLNRAEYRNAILDLLALEIDVAELLPADDASYGFDNIAASLRISPTLLERYLLAARTVSRAAVGVSALPPGVATYIVPFDLSQEGHVEGLPLGTRGGTVIQHHFPRDGEYVIQVKLALDTQDNVPRYDETHDLEVALDGERVRLFTLAGEPDSEELEQQVRFDDFEQAGLRRNIDADWRVRLAVKAGARAVSAAFLETPPVLTEATRFGPFRPLRLALKEPFERPYVGGFFNEETRSGPYVARVTITGPFESTGAGDTPSRRRILVCHPTSVTEDLPCAKTILSTLGRRAYRRPVSEAELARLLAAYTDGRDDAGFEGGIELAVRHLLMEPAFLFRVERDPADIEPDSAYRISDLELASRLSFFLWSSIPDDELLDLAERDRLGDPEVVAQQVRRMLRDSRTERGFVNNFTGQWLYTRNLPDVTPHLRLFPDFDENLRQAFRLETEMFFDSILRENRSVLELLTADYTFVNERLARHYGIPNVMGSRFRRVTLSDDSRRGLLGKGSILATTSYPHRTSPVVRGKWILENLLGMPPPPPPPDVPDLKDTNAEGQVLSMRDRMVQHRANPACASCHAMMDPLGLALENFDAVGRWRTRSEAFTPVDASGALPDGTPFEGVDGLREALLTRSELFVTTLTEKLLTYALGRGLEYYDAPAVRRIVRAAAADDYRFQSLLLGVVNSLPFQMRRSAAPALDVAVASANDESAVHVPRAREDGR